MARNESDVLKGLWQPFTQMKQYKAQEMRVIKEGRGFYVYDVNGREYLDATSSLWNVSLGHGVREIHEAMIRQLGQLEYSTLFRASNTAAVALAEQITSLLPEPLNYVFLTSNGSESVEVAIKMARQYFNQERITGRHKIVSLKRAYHGVSYGALSASGFEEDQVKFGPIVPGFHHIDPPYCYRCPLQKEYPSCQTACADELEELVQREGPDTIAAFLMEPVMGFGGVIVPPPGYMEKIAATCRKHGILLIFDEVTTGFGRTGRLFAFEHFGVQPDIVCFGKSISAGYAPLGGVAATSAIFERFYSDDPDWRFNDGSTNSGHPVCSAAGVAAIRYLLESDVLRTAAPLREKFLGDLKALVRYPFVGDVRGLGSMTAIELVDDKAGKEPLRKEVMQFVLRGLFANGVWVHSAGNLLYIMPALNFGQEHYDRVITVLDKVFRQTREMFRYEDAAVGVSA
jgi:adenosylmethionine-8-amino-7-oxononanoate aminotransferase